MQYLAVHHHLSMLYELTSSELLLCSSKHLDLKNEISFGQTDKIQGLGTVSKQVGSSGKPIDSGKMVWDMFEDKAFNEIIEPGKQEKTANRRKKSMFPVCLAL